MEFMEFLYDDTGSITGFSYEGKTYFYVKNPQGDVTNIVDSNGVNLINYYYYSYGESAFDIDESAYDYGYTRDDMDTVLSNPITYRGYYRDEETAFYYLQSRYYIPSGGRFLNADIPLYAQSQKDEFAGINLFVYCRNNPVNFSDPTGYKTKKSKKEPDMAEEIVDIIIALLFFDSLSKDMKEIFGEEFTENFFDGLANLFILVPSSVKVIVEVIKSVPTYIIDILNEEYKGTTSPGNVVMDLAITFLNAIISESGAEVGALISTWVISVLPAELIILVAGVINDKSMTASQKVMLIFLDIMAITVSNIFSAIISSIDLSGTTKLIASILSSLVPISTDIIAKIIIRKKNTEK